MYTFTNINTCIFYCPKLIKHQGMREWIYNYIALTFSTKCEQSVDFSPRRCTLAERVLQQLSGLRIGRPQASKQRKKVKKSLLSYRPPIIHFFGHQSFYRTNIGVSIRYVSNGDVMSASRRTSRYSKLIQELE